MLANVKFIQEKKLIGKYFDEISTDTGRYCFGIEDSLKALDLGAVETLIVWEGLDCTRYIFRNSIGEELVKHLDKEKEKDRSHFVDALTALDLEVIEKKPLLEWVTT